MRRSLDWRREDLLMEGFGRYYYWRIKNNDLDHGWWLQHCAEGLDLEQRLWLAHLFGQTYSVPMAYAFYQSFPDINNIDREELEEWNTQNWKRCRYANDTKYNKGHFSRMTQSYMDWLGGETQEKKLRDLGLFDEGTNLQENFKKLYEIPIKEWYKFGRMSSWLYCQAMDQIVPEVKQKPMTVFVEDGSNWSVWNGTMCVFNRFDRFVGSKLEYKPNINHKLQAVDDVLKIYDFLETSYKDIEPNMFLIESALCQYKKMHLGRDYPGHSSGDFHDRGILFEGELFPELDWTKYRQANRNLLEITRFKHQIKNDNKYFGNTGKFINLYTIFDDMEVVESTEKDPKKLYIEERWR